MILIEKDGGLSTLCHSFRVTVLLPAEGANNVSWLCLSRLLGLNSLVITFTGNFVSI